MISVKFDQNIFLKSKFKFLYLLIALALIFGACDKEVVDQIVDENLFNLKTFAWVNDESVKENLYAYTPISALFFSKYGGKLFNDGCEETANKGIKICRDPENKDNGNVTVFFGPEVLGVDGEDVNCIYNLTVRYKGSLNTVWTFNVKVCVDHCAQNGPISLYAGEKMGAVIIVKYDGKIAYICGSQ